jgi:hypothetical protein
LFVESTLFHSLQSFTNHPGDNTYRDTGGYLPLEIQSRILTAIAFHYTAITTLNLSFDMCISSSDILLISGSCKRLQNLSFYEKEDNNELDISDIDAISSLPHLKSLFIGFCTIADCAVSAMVNFKKLRHFGSVGVSHGGNPIADILAVIGRNLISLETFIYSSILTQGSISEHCPNMEYLDLEIRCEKYRSNKDYRTRMNLTLMATSKKMTSLKVNGLTVQLGTSWGGYMNVERLFHGRTWTLL